MSNCCNQSVNSSTNVCITVVEPVRNPTVNMSLPRIVRVIDCHNVLIPCAFTHQSLVLAQFCLSCLSDGLKPTQSEVLQFTQCLRSKGFRMCEGVIQVPELWLQTLEEMIDRNGENFAQIYISKLQNHDPN